MDGQETGFIGIQHDEDEEELFFRNLYCHQGLVIHKSMFDKVGLYDPQYKVYADYDWILKSYNMGIKPFLINTVIANFTMGGISQRDPESIEELTIRIKNTRLNSKMSPKNERRRGRAEYVYIKKYDTNRFKTLFDSYRDVLIWGIGMCGKECFELMGCLKINVRGIILSDPIMKEWNGVPVISADSINLNSMNSEFNNCRIIIATEKYEDEIVKTIRKSGIKKKYYIMMSDIYKWAHKNCIIHDLVK